MPFFILLLELSLIPSAQASLPAQISEKARSVLKVHCGACHIPPPLGGNISALRVFDLNEGAWASKASDRQLQDISVRLRARKAMTPAELVEVVPRGFPVPRKPTDQEINAVSEFITLELLDRALRNRN